MPPTSVSGVAGRRGGRGLRPHPPRTPLPLNFQWGAPWPTPRTLGPSGTDPARKMMSIAPADGLRSLFWSQNRPNNILSNVSIVKKLITFILASLIYSCQTEVTNYIPFIEGYWEIVSVTKDYKKIKEFKISGTIDYFKINPDLSGYRKKVQNLNSGINSFYNFYSFSAEKLWLLLYGFKIV